AIVWFVRRGPLRVICVGLIAVAFGLRCAFLSANPAWVYATPFRMDFLATGALTAILVRDFWWKEFLAKNVARIAVAATSLLMIVLFLARDSSMPTDFRAPYMRTFGLSLLCLIYGSLVAHCGTNTNAADRVCRLMRNRFLSFL